MKLRFLIILSTSFMLNGCYTAYLAGKMISYRATVTEKPIQKPLTAEEIKNIVCEDNLLYSGQIVCYRKDTNERLN